MRWDVTAKRLGRELLNGRIRPLVKDIMFGVVSCGKCNFEDANTASIQSSHNQAVFCTLLGL